MTISGVAGPLTARLSSNFDSNGNKVGGSACGVSSGVLICNVDNNTVAVSADTALLGTLATKGLNTYSATVLVSGGGGCTDCVSIALSLQIGNNGQITVTAGGLPISASGITLTAAPGLTASTQIVISTLSVAPVPFNITSVTQPWLSVSPTSGTVSSASPATLTVTGNAALTTIPGPAASFTISTAVGQPTITVNLNVTSNGITFNFSSLSFGYALNNQTYTGQNQMLTVNVTSSSSTYTISSNQSWLLINGGTTTSGVPNQTFTISVNALALGNPPAVGTYNGQISVQTANGTTATLPVTLTVSGTSNGSLTFTAASTTSGTQTQNISFTGTGSFIVLTSTTNNYNWLTANPNFFSLSGQSISIAVTADPTKVPSAGTYSGQLQIVLNGVVQQTTSVTFTVGGTVNTGPIVTPSSLTFNVPPGGNATQSLIVNGASGTSFQVGTFGNGIIVSPLSGLTLPAVLTVQVNALSAGVLQGTNAGYINITPAGSPLQQIPVTFNVLAGTILQANPANLAMLYQGGGASTTLIQPPIQLISNIDPANGGVGVPFIIGTPPSFVSLSSSSGTTPATIQLGLNSANLQPGLNSGSLTVTAPLAGNNPVTIPINILTPGGTQSQSLTLSSTSVNLTGTSGGPAVTQTVTVSGPTGSSFTAAASSTFNWLSVQPTSGTVPATLTITGSPATLNAGSTYQGTVTVTSSGQTVIMNVALTVGTPNTVTPVLSVGSNSVTFNYNQGDPVPAAQTVQVNSSGGSTTFNVTTSAAWITASPMTGLTPGTVSISVDPSRFSAGTQSGTVTVTAPGAAGSPQVIQVTLNIASLPTLMVDNNNLTFTYRTGSPAPGPQTVQVTSTGSPLAFTVSIANASWLTVTPSSGTTPATLTFSVDTSRLNVGSFPATVTISSASSTQPVMVLLVISAALPSISDVVNGASLQEGAISPGEIVLITGNSMGPDTPVQFNVTNGLLDKTLGGTVVKVGGYPAAMVSASSNAVSAIVPYEIAGKLSTFIEVDFLGQSSNIITLQVAPSSPGMFTAASSQGFPLAILNADGTPNSSDNPAAQDSPITAVITGEGQTIPAGVDGKITDPTNPPVPAQQVSATLNGEPSPSVTAAAGQVAGLMTVTVQIPNDGTTGDLVVMVGQNSSQAGVTVFVK